MDVYQIFITHNRAWTLTELVIFLVFFLFAICIAFVLLQKRKILFSQAISGLGMLFFLGIVFGSTIFTREPHADYEYKLEVFWSWREVANGSTEILKENLLNVMLLIPAGGLLPLMMHQKVVWWKGFLTGIEISAVIEFSQLIFRRGLFEWDDMIHNGIGCMVGCLIINAIQDKMKK